VSGALTECGTTTNILTTRHVATSNVNRSTVGEPTACTHRIILPVVISPFILLQGGAMSASHESPADPLVTERADALLMEQEAMSLRLALDAQLEKVRSWSFGGLHQPNPPLEYSVEEQLSELILLVSQHSDEALAKALIMTIGQPGDPDYTGRYPLHLACDTNAPFQVIQFFLQHEPTKQALLHKDKWDDLPLHTACSRKDYANVVELLLQYDDSKQSVYTKRYDGSLPIHTACR
jgi:ankyrin repeat protein